MPEFGLCIIFIQFRFREYMFGCFVTLIEFTILTIYESKLELTFDSERKNDIATVFFPRLNIFR